MLLVAVLSIFVVAPAILALAGWLQRQPAISDSVTDPAAWPLGWTQIMGSALCCCIAFNLTFFIQEIGLVVPKALTPGLTPTLFHNNHLWQGDNELAYLFQGTGVIATLLSGALSFFLVQSGRLQSEGSKLFFLWMAYHGIFMALPQFVIGAVNPYNDVGMAMDYFHLSTSSKTFLALLALGAMPPLAILLIRPFLSLANDKAVVSSGRGRARSIAQIVTLPALIALFFIIPYRVPREWVEIIVLPLIVLMVGTIWIQAYAWRISDISISSKLKPLSLKWLWMIALGLLLVFQLLLRPGITFELSGFSDSL